MIIRELKPQVSSTILDLIKKEDSRLKSKLFLCLANNFKKVLE
jgi:hypothetical protein